MSKAFTREDDDAAPIAPQRAPLPPGTKNYITPAGAQRIRAELDALLQRKRELPAEAELRAVEPRIQHLQSLLATCVVVEPAPSDTVRFGSTVSVTRGSQTETYTIVGVDEIDLDKNHISWLSPLARVLLSRRVGDRITFQSPAGREELQIVALT